MQHIREPIVLLLGAYLGVAAGFSHANLLAVDDASLRLGFLILALLAFGWLALISLLLSPDRTILDNKSSIRILCVIFSAVLLVVSSFYFIIPNSMAQWWPATPEFHKMFYTFTPIFGILSVSTILNLVR